ncbi:hypothetical protein DVS77_27125 [Mycolicibacterium moriokaense]|nr:hypothetical protein DVS77_27125 [Mycolicibacterium moriokaense]
MTTSVPAYLTWPLLVFMVVVVAIRYAFFNSSQYETYLNHTLALMVTSNLLREHAIQTVLADHTPVSITAAQQLSLAVMIFAAAEFLGFVTLWTARSPELTRRRQRYHRAAAAVLAIGFLIAATPARRAGQTLEEFGGWYSVAAWALLTGIFIALAYRLLKMAIKELLRPDAKPRERLLAAGGFVIGIAVGSTSVDAVILAAVEELGWLHTVDFRLNLHGSNIFWETVGVSLIAAVPAAKAITARIGLDATSRHWRQLQPLRADMIHAVPAIAFELHTSSDRRQKTPLDLHQTTVQIRDAILQLRAYFQDTSQAQADAYLQRYAISPSHRDAALSALQLAHAVHAKQAGASPATVDTAVILQSRSTNLEQETAELLRLARWWSHARQEAQRSWAKEMSE